MSFNFPDEETLIKYLALLSKVLIMARMSAYEFDERSARLLDAVHNVPDLLCRWQDMNESYVLADLEAYEARYCGGGHPFSEIIKHGPDPDWQLIWKGKDERRNGEDA
jgi:hypothetical protein